MNFTSIIGMAITFNTIIFAITIFWTPFRIIRINHRAIKINIFPIRIFKIINQEISF